MKSLLLFCFLATAQDFPDLQQLQKRLEADMRRGLKEMEKLFQTDQFRSLEKMFRDFHGGGTESLDYFWREGSKDRTLVIKLENAAKTPLDIRVENGQVTVSGKKEEVRQQKGQIGSSLSSRSYHFQVGPIPIPGDVDAKNPKFDKSATEVLVRFSKLEGKRRNKSIPLPPSKGERRI